MKFPEKWHIPEKLRTLFLQAGKNQGWLGSSKPIIFATSGGSDSLAMAILGWRLLPSRNIVIAHFEHGIRGKASLDDARFVASFASFAGLPYEGESAFTERALEPHESLESGARRLRYDFLRALSRKHDGAWIATGHTKNDVQETVLHNLFRGTGIRGLGGIPPRRGEIVRPVLAASRQELQSFLTAHNIPWREDLTNQDNTYRRNYIRGVLIPQIEAHINPRAGEHITALARDILAFREREEGRTRRLLETLRLPMPLTLASWNLPQARKLSSWDLRMCLMEEARSIQIPALSRSRMEKLEDLLRRSGRWCFQWKKDVNLYAFKGRLFWVRPETLLPLEKKTFNVAKNLGVWHHQDSWRFSFTISGLPSEVFRRYGARIPLVTPEETITFSSLLEWEQAAGCGVPAPSPLHVLPALSPFWPVFSWGNGGFWIPGLGVGKSDFSETPSFSRENHVTICRLLCCPRRMSEEN